MRARRLLLAAVAAAVVGACDSEGDVTHPGPKGVQQETMGRQVPESVRFGGGAVYGAGDPASSWDSAGAPSPPSDSMDVGIQGGPFVGSGG